MQFFSDDYLMHYGIKGMKWKKKRAVKDPEEYLLDAQRQVLGDEIGNHADISGDEDAKSRVRKEWTKHRRFYEGVRDTHPGSSHAHNVAGRRVNQIRTIADANRRSDLQKARKEAYKKNQKRIAKQQRKAKVNNTLKRVKNKIFVDTSGSKKIGKHLYVEHH